MNKLTARQPSWIKSIPQSEYFIYYSALSSSSSLDKAKESAVSQVLFEIIKSGNITIAGEQQYKSRDIESSGKLDNETEIIKDIIISGESRDIFGLKKADEYFRKNKGTYEYWILMRVPKNKSFTDMPIHHSNNLAPILRSAFIPGWGQFSKNQPVKGAMLISSELALLSSTFYFAYRGNDFSDKEDNEIFDMNKRQNYRDNKDLAYNIATVSLIGAAAVYAFNIYDVITSRGEPKLTYFEKESNFNIYCGLDNKLYLCYRF